MTRPADAGPASPDQTDWARRFEPDEWDAYRRVLTRARDRGLGFAVGGGLAFSYYAGRWRNTKDLDLYVLPRDRDAFVAVLDDAGFEDLHARDPYDRAWIYRGVRGEVIVDVIWQMANYHAQVDEQWLTRGDELRMDGLKVRVIPAEELIWAKLFVMQRERCDWPDLLNVLRGRAPRLDWPHLLARVGEHERLLAALLSVFGWLCPREAAALPAFVRERLCLAPPPQGGQCRDQDGRVRLLDSRPWFGPTPDARP